MDAIDHHVVFQSAELVGLLLLGLATGRRTEVETQRPVAHHVAEENVGLSGDVLRERQRTLPRLYSNMEIMSTLGIQPPVAVTFL